jgi:hypothetical protein
MAKQRRSNTEGPESFVLPECCCGNHGKDGSCCPGWLHIESDTYGPEVERCDDCNAFADDDAAIRAHDKTCPKGRACGYSIVCDCTHSTLAHEDTCTAYMSMDGPECPCKLSRRKVRAILRRSA